MDRMADLCGVLLSSVPLADRNQLRRMPAHQPYRARSRLATPAGRPLRWYWRRFLGITRERGIDIERHADSVAVELCGVEERARSMFRSTEALIVHNLALRKSLRLLRKRGSRRGHPPRPGRADEGRAVRARAAAAG